LTLLMWQPMLNAATPYTLEGIKALNVNDDKESPVF